MKQLRLGCKFLTWIAPFLFFIGCSGSGAGQLKLSLTDSATDQYHAIYVTLDEVQVHPSGGDPEGGWQTVATPQKTFNLLELVNGVREELGIATLSEGHYTQMRLILGKTPDDGINILSKKHPFANYVIDDSNIVHELKVPSGFQTGIKIVQGFDVNANGTTELLLDFNASASVVIAGSSGQYLLKPTIKILETVDFAILSGNILNSADSSTLPGALVSAQIYDPTAADPKDQVVIQTATVSDTQGAYKLFIAPGTYNIVVTKEGFSPTILPVTLAAGATLTQDISLTATTLGTLTGLVMIPSADSETFATLSFRQETTVNSATQVVEVASLNVANGGIYSQNLDGGDYSVVSSSFNQTTQANNATVTGGITTTLDISF